MMQCVSGNYDVEASLTWRGGERWERERERNTSVHYLGREMIHGRQRTGSEFRGQNSARTGDCGTEEMSGFKSIMLDVEGPEPWLHLKNKEMEALRKGPDSQKPAPCIPKAQTSFRSARRADLECLPGKPGETNSPSAHVGIALAFGKRP